MVPELFCGGRAEPVPVFQHDQCSQLSSHVADSLPETKTSQVENVRRKRRLRHGGGQQRVGLEETELIAEAEEDKLLQVHEALDDLAREDPVQAQVVKMRFFAGLKNEEVAEALGISTKTVQRYWTHAKSWLYQRIQNQR